MNLRFSVVITTHNRAPLVGRAIKSVLRQGIADLEVIVVDDASTDQTAMTIPGRFPGVRFLRQGTNQGPGAGRNRGIREATNPWVVILDDDDELIPGALATMADKMSAMFEKAEYPVLQFATSSGCISGPYVLITLEHYLTGALRGDFVPVINRAIFTEAGLAYPETRVTGEHLLWWRIAAKHGIPTWNQQMAVVHGDAPFRLSSPERQIRLARDHAELQEQTLAEYGKVLKEQYPALYRTRCLGAATYWLLAGDLGKARVHLRSAWRIRGSLAPIILFGFSYFPREWICWIFSAYRRVRRAM